MKQSEQTPSIFEILNDPKIMEAANKRFQELSAEYPDTEIDRAIERAKRAQWWNETKDLVIDI